MKLIKRIPLNAAFVMATCFYGLTLLLHILVLVQVIPYNWVNGGHLNSYDEQIPVTFANMFIAVMGLLFNFYAKYKRGQLGKNDGKSEKAMTIIFWVLTGIWTLSFLMQLLGTPFERYGLSILLILGIVSHLRLALATN